MYEYHRRIVDRYQKRVVSLAVLADTSPGFRPAAYEEETWGCRLPSTTTDSHRSLLKEWPSQLVLALRRVGLLDFRCARTDAT
jgi:hypothetical protein